MVSKEAVQGKKSSFFKKNGSLAHTMKTEKSIDSGKKRESVDTKASKKEEIMVHVAKTFIKAIK